MRSTSAVARHKRHKRVLKQTKGFYGRSKNCYRIAKQALEKSWQYAYVGRKIKKREYKSIWIQRINACVRSYNLNYSKFMHLLKQNGFDINRKVLAKMAYMNNEDNNIIGQLIDSCTK